MPRVSQYKIILQSCELRARSGRLLDRKMDSALKQTIVYTAHSEPKAEYFVRAESGFIC